MHNLSIQYIHITWQCHYRLQEYVHRDFPGSPVVIGTLRFQCTGHRFNPWLGRFHMPCGLGKQVKKTEKKRINTLRKIHSSSSLGPIKNDASQEHSQWCRLAVPRARGSFSQIPPHKSTRSPSSPGSDQCLSVPPSMGTGCQGRDQQGCSLHLAKLSVA